MAKGNFFSNLFSSIFGGNDSDATKKRLLRTIAKNLSKTKYKFYKFNSHEVDPGFAKYLYEIYKAIAPAKEVFETTTPNALKNVVLSLSLTEAQKAAVEDLSEESIAELSRKMNINELTAKIEENLEIFSSGYDNVKIFKTDELYSKLIMFKNFIQFDYYFLLKKFDSSLREGNFSTTPRFTAINGSYVLEDLKNFMSVAWVLPFEADWEDIFKLLKSVKGKEPFSQGTWRKVLVRIKNIKERHILEMMIQLISENPTYAEEFRVEEHHIVDDYIASIKKTANSALDNIKAQQKAGKIDNLLSQIFGSTEVESLKYYNITNSSPFERKELGSYRYADPLAYLKAFLLDYTKKDIRELSDILLVRGEWTNQQLATPMSDAFHQLMEISEKITALDNRMAENAETGVKLKTLLPRADRDKDSRNIIQTLLGDANDEAAHLIQKSMACFVNYDRNLKMLLEDFVKMPRSEIMMNWKDLDHFAEGRLKQMCVDVYKKIYLLVTLLQAYPLEFENE